MLRRGYAPRAIRCIFIKLIPKPEGGDRPIGVFVAVARVFNRFLRRTYGMHFLAKHVPGHWYGVTCCNGHVRTLCASPSSANPAPTKLLSSDAAPSPADRALNGMNLVGTLPSAFFDLLPPTGQGNDDDM